MVGALQGGWGLRNNTDAVLWHYAHTYIACTHERGALGSSMVKPVFTQLDPYLPRGRSLACVPKASLRFLSRRAVYSLLVKGDR